MEEQIRFLKALGDPTRLRIFRLLLGQEICVCELQELLGISQPAVSQHVAKLKQAGLITERRSGLWTFYQASPARVQAEFSALAAFLTADLTSLPSMAADLQRLRRINRVAVCQLEEGVG